MSHGVDEHVDATESLERSRGHVFDRVVGHEVAHDAQRLAASLLDIGNDCGRPLGVVVDQYDVGPLVREQCAGRAGYRTGTARDDGDAVAK